MANTEFNTALGTVKICIYCGKTSDEVEINRDHYYPQVLGRRPKKRETKRFFKPLIHSTLDIFPLCLEHHTDIDREKIDALRARGKYRSLNPVGLVEFLRENYPITTNPRYYDLQIGAMIESNRTFVDLIRNMNGELPKVLRYKYINAMSCAEDYIKYLESLKLSGPLSRIDFQGSELLKYTHQTSVA